MILENIISYCLQWNIIFCVFYAFVMPFRIAVCYNIIIITSRYYLGHYSSGLGVELSVYGLNKLRSLRWRPTRWPRSSWKPVDWMHLQWLTLLLTETQVYAIFNSAINSFNKIIKLQILFVRHIILFNPVKLCKFNVIQFFKTFHETRGMRTARLKY